MTDADRWLPPRVAWQPRARLFCLPFAGGGASAYAGWAPRLADIELCPFFLPGRERRITEPPAADLAALIPPMIDAIAARQDAPWALFGHSLGAIVAFEVARAARRAGLPPPALLAVAASEPPDTRDVEPISHLPEAAFIEKVRGYGGLPDEILAEPELVALIAPTLRADFRLSESYAYTREPPLDAPILALGGTDDIPAERLLGWAGETRAGFDTTLYPGGHFFLREHEAEILARLKNRLLPDPI